MPKLPAAAQKAAAEATAWTPGERGAWPKGRYLVFAKELVQKDPKAGGDPYWHVAFQGPAKYDQGIGGCVFENISTGVTSAGKQKAFFESFGYTVDSDTNEFVGKPDEVCWIFVDTKPGFKDPEKLENEVLGWAPVNPEDELPPLRDE